MDGPGTITWEEFIENAANLVAASNKIFDGWKLRGYKECLQDVPGQAYLFRQSKSTYPDDIAVKRLNEEEKAEEEWSSALYRDPYAITRAMEKPLIVEHHVLWSMSYSVPVLYFNGWKSDFVGMNPVSVEEAQRFVLTSTLDYTELSQAIHPILGVPYLHLHPCLSHELLRNVPKSKNKLVSWLSLVAPAALRLVVRQEYYKLTVTEEESLTPRHE